METIISPDSVGAQFDLWHALHILIKVKNILSGHVWTQERVAPIIKTHATFVILFSAGTIVVNGRYNRSNAVDEMRHTPWLYTPCGREAEPLSFGGGRQHQTMRSVSATRPQTDSPQGVCVSPTE